MPLTAMPIAATKSTVLLATGGGACSRTIASIAIAPDAKISSSALASAARIELRLSRRCAGAWAGA
jgi:hypothetical protein